MSKFRVGLLILGFGTGIARGAPSEGDYKTGIESWRQKREERLKADGGWLTVAGLFWLKEGANRFGTAADNEIVLPEGSTAAHAGAFELAGQKITLHVEPGVEAKIEDKPAAAETNMVPDSDGPPTVVAFGPRIRMQVISRDHRFAIRMKDFESPMRKAFKGLEWYPVDEKWHVTARFEPYDPPKQAQIPTILGYVDEMPCPGVAVFTLDGHEVRLEPVIEDPNEPELFFIFRDATSGKETYGAGRFLYAEMPKDGKVELDFNKAYTPPCGFTPYATCPLPPPQNRLDFRLEAGEKFAGHAEVH